MSVKTIDDLPWALVQILSHWKEVNESLAPAELGLSGNYGREQMLADLERLNKLTESIFERRRAYQTEAAAVADLRKAVKEGLRSFCLSVRGLYSGSEFVGQLPNLPDTLAHPSVFLAPAKRIVEIWQRINLSPQPLVLGSGLTLPKYLERLKACEAAFASREASQAAERAIRADREKLADSLRKRAMQYRDVVKGSFPVSDRRVRSLPNLWPPTRRKPKPN